MTILIINDIDDLHWRNGSGNADLVIACGDISDSLILEAADAFNTTKIFAVKGNHDPATVFPKPIIDLHLHIENNGGVSFGGFNGSWKYKPRGHFLYEQEEASRMLAGFPRVDIFVSHNSPKGVHDKQDDIHFGFEALKSYIEHQKPRLFIHGHQHVNRETVIGETCVMGVYGHKIIELDQRNPFLRIATDNT